MHNPSCTCSRCAGLAQDALAPAVTVCACIIIGALVLALACVS